MELTVDSNGATLKEALDNRISNLQMEKNKSIADAAGLIQGQPSQARVLTQETACSLAAKC